MRRLKRDASGTKRFKSDFGTQTTERIIYDGLEPCVLTTEEEIEYRQLYDWSPGSQSSCSPSPPRETEAGTEDYDDKEDGTVTEPGHNHKTRSPQHLHVHSHQKLVEFLTTTGSKAELLATNEWNKEPKRVYKLFNITKCIVHPDYFLASDSFPDNRITTIIDILETSSMQKLPKTYCAWLPWSYLKKRMEPFLACFNGFEKLADIFQVHDDAQPLKKIFSSKIEFAEQTCGITWLAPFTIWARRMAEAEDISEAAFKEYVKRLFDTLYLITNGRFSLRSTALKLVLPSQKYSPAEKQMAVTPDIIVQAAVPEIILVGEIKPFGCSGLTDQDHRGRKLRHVHPDISHSRLTPQTALETDQPGGQGDNLSPTVNEKERSVPSVTTDEPHASTSKDLPRGRGDQLSPTEESVLSVTTDEPHASTSTSVTTDEPHASTSKDLSQGQGDQLCPTEESVLSVTTDEPHASISKRQTGKSTKSKISIPTRSLDGKEEFKVNKYLPQLFGQMLAAMENNKRAPPRFRFCKPYENVQFGFAVEGFKLRFVKLTMIDVMKKELPTVRALLTGRRIKCHISITQEYNLIKRHHLEMFYQMILAMRYSCY